VFTEWPKVRADAKFIARGHNKEAPPKRQGEVYWMEAPKGRERMIGVGQGLKGSSPCTFCMQNHLHHDRIYATNFVLALVASLPHYR
jgi:hypothetical protein